MCIILHLETMSAEYFSMNVVCVLYLVLDQHAAEFQGGSAELSMSNWNSTAPARLPSPPKHSLW